MKKATRHTPVLLEESTAPLIENKGNIYVDATLGEGGHLSRLLKHKPQARLFAIDRDKGALHRAKERFSNFIESRQVVLLHGNFADLKELLAPHNTTQVDGIIADLGISSLQLEDEERGFSFSRKGPLDMRMDRESKTTAMELVNHYPEKELSRLFWKYGEERHCRKIAKKIVHVREKAPLRNTLALAQLIENLLPSSHHSTHPATRVFQALRIAVNQELASLDKLLNLLPNILRPYGVVSLISFHSLEDRPIKQRFHHLTADCICPPEIPDCSRCHKPFGTLKFRKPLIASKEEVMKNPRSRSAKLRVFIKNGP